MYDDVNAALHTHEGIMKPHIIKRGNQWKCRYAMLNAYGDSPLDAYKRWLSYWGSKTERENCRIRF
jgi:hypothetical protein